eukprot:PhF_6_TR26246/c0_g1_i3/m.37529
MLKIRIVGGPITGKCELEIDPTKPVEVSVVPGVLHVMQHFGVQSLSGYTLYRTSFIDKKVKPTSPVDLTKSPEAQEFKTGEIIYVRPDEAAQRARGQSMAVVQPQTQQQQPAVEAAAKPSTPTTPTTPAPPAPPPPPPQPQVQPGSRGVSPVTPPQPPAAVKATPTPVTVVPPPPPPTPPTPTKAPTPTLPSRPTTNATTKVVSQQHSKLLSVALERQALRTIRRKCILKWLLWAKNHKKLKDAETEAEAKLKTESENNAFRQRIAELEQQMAVIASQKEEAATRVQYLETEVAESAREKLSLAQRVAQGLTYESQVQQLNSAVSTLGCALEESKRELEKERERLRTQRDVIALKKILWERDETIAKLQRMIAVLRVKAVRSGGGSSSTERGQSITSPREAWRLSTEANSRGAGDAKRSVSPSPRCTAEHCTRHVH